MEIPLILNIVDQKTVEKAVEDFKANGKVLAIDSSMFEIEPYYLPPFPGLSLPAVFPFCCLFHEFVFKGAVEFLMKFPNCCEYHAPLINQKWFKKEKYMNFPDRVLKPLANTEKCIEENIQNENWHKTIGDYIELAIMRMGQPPKGFGSPLGLQLLTDNIKGRMKTQKFIPKDKRKIIENFIDDCSNNKSSNEKFNLVELMSIYETWLKLFPFELPFFKALKDQFHKTRPVIKGENEVNSFIGLPKGTLFKTKDFCEYLKNLTNSLLSKINTPALINEYSLDEAKALNFEMVKQQHTIRQENLFSSILQ